MRVNATFHKGFRPLVLLAALATTPGCATLLKLFEAATEPPTAQFQKAEVRSVSLEDATIAATFTVTNPNPLALSLEGLDWKFALDGKQLLAGTAPDGLRLPARGSTALVIPIKVPFTAIPDLFTTFSTKDEVPYAVNAVATVRTPIGPISLPLDWSALLPVPKLPTVALATARLDQVSLLGASMSVVLKVTNPNVFPLPLDALSGAVVVADRNVAQLGLSSPRPLGPKETIDVTMPIQVSFAQLGLAAATAISTRQAAVGVRGSAAFAGHSVPLDFRTTLAAP